MPSPDIYQLHISLDDIKPLIWRRILAPGNISLLDLHFLIQTAMGWTNSHLHAFLIAGREYGLPTEEIFPGQEEFRDSSEHQLNQFNLSPGDRIPYIYDFGDNWRHTILVEDIRTAGQEPVPACLDGARACPPEDVGSTGGYADFLEAIANPGHPEHGRFLAWIGGTFDPEAFHLTETDRALRSMETSEMMRVHLRYEPGEPGPHLVRYDSVTRWEQGLSPSEQKLLEALPLRRDIVSALTWLQQNPTRSTAKLGNFPLKAIRGIAALMVVPPPLEEKIGDRVYTLRREYEIRPIQFIHTLLETGGLITGAPGKKLILTERGERFLEADSPLQVWFLLETWWYHTNWMYRYDIEYLGIRMDGHLIYTMLYQLLDLPVEEPIPFTELANHLVENMHRFLRDETADRRYTLRHFIDVAVVRVLARFEIMHLELPPDPDGALFLKPVSCTITHRGRKLLQTLVSQ